MPFSDFRVIANWKTNHPLRCRAELILAFDQVAKKYLGCEIVAAGESCLLKRNGFDIVLDHVTAEVPVWPKNFHFGLEVDSLDDVHTLYKEFMDGGVRMETEVFNNSRGSRFFCRSPGGVLIGPKASGGRHCPVTR